MSCKFKDLKNINIKRKTERDKQKNRDGASSASQNPSDPCSLSSFHGISLSLLLSPLLSLPFFFFSRLPLPFHQTVQVHLPTFDHFLLILRLLLQKTQREKYGETIDDYSSDNEFSWCCRTAGFRSRRGSTCFLLRNAVAPRAFMSSGTETATSKAYGSDQIQVNGGGLQRKREENGVGN